MTNCGGVRGSQLSLLTPKTLRENIFTVFIKDQVTVHMRRNKENAQKLSECICDMYLLHDLNEDQINIVVKERMVDSALVCSSDGMNSISQETAQSTMKLHQI